MLTVPQQLDAILANQAKQIALEAALATVFGAGPPAAPSAMRADVARAPGGNVAVTFSWDAAPPDGSVDHYTLQELNPDGTTHGDLLTVPATQTSATVTQPDDPQTYSAALRAVNSAGVGSPPAVASFVPHTEPPPPPPPLVPATPTGFTATVSDTLPPPAPVLTPRFRITPAPTSAAELRARMTAVQWAQLVEEILAAVLQRLGGS